MQNHTISKSNRTLTKEQMEMMLAKLRESIESSTINTFTTKTRKILGSNWSYLPNCGKFDITVCEDNNPALLLAGIEKHLDPEIKIVGCHSSISIANKFMHYQIKRLKRLAATNPKLFWDTAWYLMERSNAFRISAWNHVFPKWHRDMPLWKVIKTNKKVSDIINNMKSDMKFKRVYIPKGTSDWRPLGVPTAEWRIYTFMLGAMLGLQFLPTLLDSQHGFRPNLGALSAWKALVKDKVLDSDYIYEVDLEQYFPTIKLRPILTALYRAGTPALLVRHIEDLCRQQPSLPPAEKDHLLNESEVIIKHHKLGELYKRYPKSILSILTEISFRWEVPDFEKTLPPGWEALHRKVDNIIEKMYTLDEEPTIDIVPTSAALSNKVTVHEFANQSEVFREGDILANWESVLQWGGLPQGSGISPILTSLPLKTFYGQSPSLSYADDGLFYWNLNYFKLENKKNRKNYEILEYSDKYILVMSKSEDGKTYLYDPRKEIKDDKFDGIIIHKKKSGYVKFMGIWLIPLKFLGLEYNGLTDSFRAHTRKGARLELPSSMKDDLSLAWQVISEDMDRQDANFKGYRKIRLPHPSIPLEEPVPFETYLQRELEREKKFIQDQLTGRKIILDDENPSLEDVRAQVRALPDLPGRSEETRRRQSMERWLQSKENYRAYQEHDDSPLPINYVEDEIDNPYRSWAELFGSKLIGIIQSRLYANDFDLKMLEQDFKYTFTKNSWAYVHKKHDLEKKLNVFNSSSFASHSLYHMFQQFKFEAYHPNRKDEEFSRNFSVWQTDSMRIYTRSAQEVLLPSGNPLHTPGFASTKLKPKAWDPNPKELKGILP